MRIKKIFAVAVAAVVLTGCTNVNPIVLTTSTPSPVSIATPTAAPVPAATPTPAPTPVPDPYFTGDEQVTTDYENGHWLYSSPTLWVEVYRVADEANTVTYFTAEVRVKPGETERAGFSNPDHPGRSSGQLGEIAQAYGAVVAINGDYMDSNAEDPKGIIIRDGEIYLDEDNEDTLAFMPDGTLQIFEPDAVSAKELLARGVKNAYSFGPTLIKDGVIQNDISKHRLRRKNPRSALGMMAPYHYRLIVVDGRDSDYSTGMTLRELAVVFASYGCKTAYNFDGGASATMAFMGEHISVYEGERYGQRSIPDALMFGNSALVAYSAQ